MLHFKLPRVWRFILGDKKSKAPSIPAARGVSRQARAMSQAPKLGQRRRSAAEGGAQPAAPSLQEGRELDNHLCVFIMAK